jgi:hypothetical protein
VLDLRLNVQLFWKESLLIIAVGSGTDAVRPAGFCQLDSTSAEQVLLSPTDSDLGSVLSERLSPGRRPRQLRRDNSVGLQSVLSMAADEVTKYAHQPVNHSTSKCNSPNAHRICSSGSWTSESSL